MFHSLTYHFLYVFNLKVFSTKIHACETGKVLVVDPISYTVFKTFAHIGIAHSITHYTIQSFNRTYKMTT